MSSSIMASSPFPPRLASLVISLACSSNRSGHLERITMKMCKHLQEHYEGRQYERTCSQILCTKCCLHPTRARFLLSPKSLLYALH